MAAVLHFARTDDKWSGLKAGLVFGIAFVQSPIYVVQDAALISIGLLLWLWLRDRRQVGRALVHWVLLFGPAFGTLVFYRLITMFYTARDFPKISDWRVHLDFVSVLCAEVFVLSLHRS